MVFSQSLRQGQACPVVHTVVQFGLIAKASMLAIPSCLSMTIWLAALKLFGFGSYGWPIVLLPLVALAAIAFLHSRLGRTA